MFKRFCNGKEGFGPRTDNNDDLTRCSQGLFLFFPICFIFILLMIYQLYKLKQVYKSYDKNKLFYHLSVSIDPSTNISDFAVFRGTNWELWICIILVFSLGCGEAVAIAVPHMSNVNNNWVVWTLGWELAVWLIGTVLYYQERKYSQILGIGNVPSLLTRIFWISQTLLAVKNFESALLRVEENNSSENFGFWIEVVLLIPTVILGIRAFTIEPEMAEDDFDYSTQKVSMKPIRSSSVRGGSNSSSSNDSSNPQLSTKTAEEKSSIFGILTFSWLSPMFKTGYSRALEMSDLNYLRDEHRSQVLVDRFYKKWYKAYNEAYNKNDNKLDENKSNNTNNSNNIISVPTPHRSLNSNTQLLLEHNSSNENTSSKHDFSSRGNENKKEDEKRVSLFKTLVLSFGGPFLTAGPLKLLYDITQYSGPLFLELFIHYSEDFSHRKSAVKKGYLVALLMFCTYMTGTFILHQYFQRCFITGMQVRAALIGACYEKAMKLTNTSRSKKTTGELMTMMTVDIRKVRDLFPYCWMLISAPFQITMAIYLLYRQIEWTVFVGVGVQVIFMGPFQTKVAQAARKIQEKLMKVRDKRVKVINEVFGSMKIVKMYAWELSFGKKISDIREEELKMLKCYVWWYTAMYFFWGWAPTLVTLTSFIAYTATGHTLTPTKAFTALALFNLLRFPLAMFPAVIVAAIVANVSFKRIRQFLESNELDPNVITFDKNLNNSSQISILNDNNNNNNNSNKYPLVILNNCSFSWDDEGHQLALTDVNCKFLNNTISMIIGETGSGKTCLLSSLLGNVHKVSGDIIYGPSLTDGNKRISIAYSSQVAWIQNATIKDNILFGKEYNDKLYKKCLNCCALEDDLKILEAGDMTEIGEKGINLSGGQKQRISLARAVYSECDVMIFDDPLSAVDPHVANHIFTECFLKLLKNKTIILATHAVSFLRYADNIIVMEKGKIKMQGTLSELSEANINLTKFVLKRQKSNISDDSDSEEDEKESDNKLISRAKSIEKSKDKTIDKKNEKKKKGELIKDEEREIGDVDWKMYKLYIDVGGGILFVSQLILAFVLYIFTLQVSTLWLGAWSNEEDKPKHKRKHGSWYYLEIYTYIQLGSLVFFFYACVVALVTRIRASKNLHSRLLDRLLHAPMSFFDTTPIGRIINRFSRDMYAVDIAVPSSWASAIRISVYIFGVIGIVCIVTPYFAIGVIPLALFYWYVQRYFIATSRELRRLSSLMNSPIYSNYSETLAGVYTIRAFSKEQAFSDKNKNMVDSDHEAYYPSVSANRWLAIRLEFLGNMLIFIATLSCCLTKPSAGLVGVALSTIMSVTQSLNWFVRQKSQLEQDIVSVERIEQYNKTIQEAPYEIKETKPDKDWPQNGKIEFYNIYMKYRPELKHVLNGLTFTVKGGCKVGVIGRTGAGKSSLFLTLLRLIEYDKEAAPNSYIKIDNIDISKIGLLDLRSRLSVIPQDPTLFTGSVRFNLDPFNVYKDDPNVLINALKLSHLWEALVEMSMELSLKKVRDKEKEKEKEKKDKEKKNKNKNNKNDVKLLNDSINDSLLRDSKSNLKDSSVRERLMNSEHFKEINPLDFEVEEDGANFSVGQRQLLCLARAIVRQCKILLLDEATSAVDPQTDSVIQETISNVFGKDNGCTILTIAHRINTILNYDYILIMDQGKVLEYDTPTNLLSPNSNSKFGEIVKQSFGVNLSQINNQINNKINIPPQLSNSDNDSNSD